MGKRHHFFYRHKSFRHPFVNRDWSTYHYKPKKNFFSKIIHKVQNVVHKIENKLEKGAKTITKEVINVAKEVRNATEPKTMLENLKKMEKLMEKGLISVDDKIHYLESKLDSKTYGMGSIMTTAILTEFCPEIILATYSIQLASDIAKGVPPQKALQGVAMAVAQSYFMGEEITTLKMAQIMGQEKIKQKVLSSKVGKGIMKYFKSKLPKKLK